jgi:hypothetical protein
LRLVTFSSRSKASLTASSQRSADSKYRVRCRPRANAVAIEVSGVIIMLRSSPSTQSAITDSSSSSGESWIVVALVIST